MSRFFLLSAALNGFSCVLLGAFGAHALEGRIEVDLLGTYQTAVQYQMFHTVALFAVAWMAQRGTTTALKWSGRLFIAGIVLFSGSLYLLALTGVRVLGAITPVGGVAFLAAWLLLARAVWGSRDV
jgi:uncharacterized membrane protein YgdD (TMEM256/DUF423 family)